MLLGNQKNILPEKKSFELPFQINYAGYFLLLQFLIVPSGNAA